MQKDSAAFHTTLYFIEIFFRILWQVLLIVADLKIKILLSLWKCLNILEKALERGRRWDQLIAVFRRCLEGWIENACFGYLNNFVIWHDKLIHMNLILESKIYLANQQHIQPRNYSKLRKAYLTKCSYKIELSKISKSSTMTCLLVILADSVR